MEKIIELKSMELADILGIGDGHIKLIESNIPVSITARGDLLNIKELQNVISKIITEKGPIEILINNAATIGKILPLNEKSEEEIIYEYNLNSIF